MASNSQTSSAVTTAAAAAAANDKLTKQRAFLAPLIEAVDHTLEHGVNALRYHKVIEADQCEQQLKQYRAVLEAIPKNKQEMKSAVEGIEAWTYYMAHLYNEAFLRDDGDVDARYEEKISRADTEYQQKVAKAFEAKQKRAPGFDGQGGGRSRGNGGGTSESKK